MTSSQNGLAGICPLSRLSILSEKMMSDLKDLKQAILEIPKLVELLKKAIHVSPMTMSSSFTAMKPQEEAIKSSDEKTTDATPEFKTLKESFEKKLAWQKEHFEKEIKALKENFSVQAAELNADKESQSKTLKEMFDVISRLANAPTLPSAFKKKDGEPNEKSKNVFEEAKALSQKVFPN